MIGRDEERSVIGRLLMDARSGRSGALVLCGEPGVGKSVLLAHAIELADGMRILQRALEHTLAYDAAVLGDGRPPAARLATIGQPTLVATGQADGFIVRAADAIAAIVPRAERVTLEGQSHAADPKAVAPVLERFFSGSEQDGGDR